MSGTQIARISMPSRDVFWSEYVIPRRPVIITDLFAGQPIEQVRTHSDAKAAWGQVPVEVQMEYSSAAKAAPASRASATGTMTMGEYLEFIEANPDTNIMCTEYATPTRVSAQYRLPDLCKLTAHELSAPEILGLPRRWGDHDLLSNMFLGNRGNYAHLHYDGDHRQVLLYQVFGRKRVILFQPQRGTKLNVLDAFMQGFCNTYLEHMSDDERDAFVAAAGGYQAVLEPGEAVYMPMLIWHYLEYLDTGMSVNFRFGRNNYGRFLCIDNFHRDYYIQNVSPKMVDSARAGRDYADALEQIKAAFLRPAATRLDKVREMRALFKSVCAKISPEADPQNHCPPEREAQQLAQIEAELSTGMRYSNTPASAASLGLTEGPITPAQNRAIRGRVRECAYPAAVLDKVIYNRFAKPTLESLSRTEAALLMRTLASPGAVW